MTDRISNIPAYDNEKIVDPSSYEHIPVGEPKPEPAPTLEDLIPQKSYPVDKSAVAKLFDRTARPAPAGETNRKTLTFTISLQTDQEWRDFLETYTGTLPQRGVGISSPMVELSMLTLMGVVADYKTDEVAIALGEISPSPASKESIKRNLHNLADRI